MSSRPFFCPACRHSIGTLSTWVHDYRGKRRGRLRIIAQSATVEKSRNGIYVHCRCGKRIRVAENVEVSIGR